MFVIGTAGHVDHGKSTLIQAISGINPDRLREEQEREMTIDLGFAWVQLPSGREVSIVDVPGHEDFIKNMLAGVGGIDLALLVVAADEAVMPQTREHLAILDLLQIPRGMIALTKADLIDDPVWLDLVAEEVREIVADTVLASAPIVPVSAVTGQGLDILMETLDTLLADAIPRADVGSPRLPIDRAFTISGFGTVVTGTLVGGQLTVGDTVEIVPGGLTARLRGLQSHKTKLDHALPGTRVAANLTGVDLDDLSRGQVVTRPGILTPTRLIDVELVVLADSPWPISHNMVVDLFTGAANVLGRTRVLNAEQIAQGETGWVQLALREPVAVSRYDRFIVRLPSPSLTLGGGRIIQPHPVRRHRRFSDAVARRLEVLAEGTPRAVLLALLQERGPMTARALVRQSQIAQQDAAEALQALVQEEQVLCLAQSPEDSDRLATWDGLIIAVAGWEQFIYRATGVLERYHRERPLRAGMPREEFKSRFDMPGELGNQILERAQAQGLLTVTAETVALPEHDVALGEAEQVAVDDLLSRFRDAPFMPPSFAEVEAQLGGALAQYLIESGRLVKMGDSVVFTPETMEEMIERLKGYLAEQEKITVAQVRDLFDTSRKYAVAFLEEMDRRRITKRIGDVRVMR